MIIIRNVPKCSVVQTTHHEVVYHTKPSSPAPSLTLITLALLLLICTAFPKYKILKE